MIKYKTNVLELLKSKGYATYKLRKDKILGESTLQKMRTNILLSWAELNMVCSWLDCQLSDIIEYVPDTKNHQQQEPHNPNPERRIPCQKH